MEIAVEALAALVAAVAVQATLAVEVLLIFVLNRTHYMQELLLPEAVVVMGMSVPLADTEGVPLEATTATQAEIWAKLLAIMAPKAQEEPKLVVDHPVELLVKEDMAIVAVQDSMVLEEEADMEAVVEHQMAVEMTIEVAVADQAEYILQKVMPADLKIQLKANQAIDCWMIVIL